MYSSYWLVVSRVSYTPKTLHCTHCVVVEHFIVTWDVIVWLRYLQFYWVLFQYLSYTVICKLYSVIFSLRIGLTHIYAHWPVLRSTKVYCIQLRHLEITLETWDVWVKLRTTLVSTHRGLKLFESSQPFKYYFTYVRMLQYTYTTIRR